MDMNCNVCGRQNRPTAKYCKWCGKPIVAQGRNEAQPGFDTLIGKNDIACQLRDCLSSAVAIKTRGASRGVRQRAQLCFAITGVAGVGKSYLADVIANEFTKAGIITSGTKKVVKSADYEEFIKNLNDNIKPIKDNVLIIEEAQKLCPNERADNVTLLDKVLQRCTDWSSDPDKPIVIFVGDEDFIRYLNNNPTSRSVIKYVLNINVPSIKDIAEVCMAQLRQYNYQTNEETRLKVERVLMATKRRAPSQFNNFHEATAIAYAVDSNPAFTSASIVSPNMIEGEEFIPKTLEQVFAEFDKYVGIEEIKQVVKETAIAVEELSKKGESPCKAIKSHYCFVGNPGTGKTTMARLFAEALGALGALPQGHLVEVDPQKLKSKYINESGENVRKYIKQAMGGVLFIDEAYGLWAGDDDKEGKQAIDTLLKDCEDLRGQFVCIIAGYPLDMDRFYKANAGLERRFDKRVNFRDYRGDELTQIFKNMATSGKEPVVLGEDLQSQIGAYFDKVYLTRTNKFGNAGTVRNILSDARDRMKERVRRQLASGEITADQKDVMIMDDVEPQQQKTVDDILASLDDLIGMDSVKEQIREIAQSVEVERRMMEMGIGEATVENVHIVLTGNPGTGKTTVAKRMGEVFKAIGIIPTDKVIVKKAEDIFDSFANSAGRNMTAAVDDAMGGILFLDEAYALLPKTAPGEVSKSGTEAINALMTCMSERVGQFITIVAGYKTEIEEFIRNANPGFERRFTYRIHIPDYSNDALFKIFMQQVAKKGMTMTDDAQALLKLKIDEMVTAKDEKFGNAGTMVNLFGEVYRKHSKSLTREDLTDRNRLTTITKVAIPYDPPHKLNIEEIMSKLDHLVGLESVKNAVRGLADTIQAAQMRSTDSGNKEKFVPNHYLFLGNPGTGKTTVARLMGDIFYSLGLLPSNKLIELSAKDLKAGFVGQSGPKTHDAIMRGMGGVVFIDEAYSINQGDGNVGFGEEVVAELLQMMVNYRGKFVLIAAGYPREMAEWLNTNAGLPDRFPHENYITFEDYTADELCQIALNIIKAKNLIITEAAKLVMANHFNRLVANKSGVFGNARNAGNYVDSVIIKQGRRLREEMNLPGFDRERLYILEPEDMKVD